LLIQNNKVKVYRILTCLILFCFKVFILYFDHSFVNVLFFYISGYIIMAAVTAGSAVVGSHALL